MRKFLLIIAFATALLSCKAQTAEPAAFRLDAYLPFLQGKKVGIFANQTTIAGLSKTHLVDSLRSRGIDIRLIFAPEHGFRGDADAGAKIADSKDPKTGIPIISLYGTKRKPTNDELKQIDLMLFDIQDVGVRFYTYISSLEEIMNACFENGTPLLVLDRPNPNGFYIDGPVLEKSFRSFVGMQPVPVVYGLTIGEYALMLVGEKWLSAKANEAYASFDPNKDPNKPFLMKVIPCTNYTHKSYYELPIPPSPNLPNMQSILLYPSTCYFEGTDVSLGRGTDKPFQVYGHPTMPKTLYSFTPRSVPGATNPPQLNKTCYGADLTGYQIDITDPQWQRMQLRFLLDAYRLFPNKNNFFLKSAKSNPKPQDFFFNKLAGNSTLMKQIINGKSEEEIRKSWEPGLNAFQIIRKKYLLYPDFE